VELLDEILKWPVIVQGALGSGVFWLFLLIGKWLTNFSKRYIEKFFHIKSKNSDNIDAMVLNAFVTDDGHMKTGTYVLMVFAGLHYFIKAFIYFGLGWFFQNLIPTFSLLGYIVGFYYLFTSLSYLPQVDKYSHMSLDEKKDKLAELEARNEES
jgi:hypothetical protein